MVGGKIEMIIEFEKKKPYFMSNEEWYYFDENEKTFKLTAKAPLKAQEEYQMIFSSPNEIFKPGYMSEYLSYIYEKIIKLTGDKESAELFEIDLSFQ